MIPLETESNMGGRIGADYYASLAQLDRASGFEPEGRGFESLRARVIVRRKESGRTSPLCFPYDY